MTADFKTRSTGQSAANPDGFGPEDDRPGKKTTLGGRIFMTLFGLPFMGMGLLFMILAGFMPMRTASSARGWDEVPCKILRSETTGTGKKDAKVAVAYSYAYHGTHYTATMPDIARKGMSGDNEGEYAREFIARHPAGKDDRCRVNPKNPAEATLECAIPGMCWFIIPFSSIFVLVGAGVSGAGLGLFKRRSKGFKNAHGPAGTSPFAKPGSLPVRAIGIAFGMIFFCAGAAFGYFMGVRPALKAQDAKTWAKTPCRIVSSSVGSHAGDKGGSTYSVDIEYTYWYRGKTYTSDDYDFTGGSSSGYDDKAAAVRQYPAGSTRECWVNPKNPDEAVISRKLTWVTRFFGFGFSGVFMLVGGYVSVAAAMGKLQSKPFGRNPAPVPGPDGRIFLKSGSGPVAALIGLLFFSAIWNGMVFGLLVPDMLKGFGPGRSPGLFDWFHALFAVPFIVIGMGLIIGTLACFAKLWTPRIRLETDRLPSPGGNFTLHWSVSGNYARIASMQIFLEGIEEATGTRNDGKGENSTFTAKRPFRRLRIAEFAGQISDSGTASFKLPADLPPTLVLSKNAIRWRVLVLGVVNGRMKIRSEYPVEIDAAANPFA